MSKVIIGTPEGELIPIRLTKNTITSLCRGAVPKLREYGWDIAKRNTTGITDTELASKITNLEKLLKTVNVRQSSG